VQDEDGRFMTADVVTVGAATVGVVSGTDIVAAVAAEAAAAGEWGPSRPKAGRG
jgi:hypothetical protein